MTVALAVTVMGLGSALSQDRGSVKSSLLLLIDASGSMGDEIGNGNPEVKIEAAKRAAADALSRAAGAGSVEVAVLAFSGGCQNPVPRYQDFTRDVDRLTGFIGRLQPGGGTPMADALLFANRYMAANGSGSASDRMIMLLADGQNDCGDIDNALATLQASGVIFRHETVGFGITPNSGAAEDLRQIATRTGGAYHHAADATQLTDVFMEFVDTLSVIDMLGRFGQRAQAVPNATPGAAVPTQGNASQAGPQQANNSGLSSMIGRIRARAPVDVPPRAGLVPGQAQGMVQIPRCVSAARPGYFHLPGGFEEQHAEHANMLREDIVEVVEGMREGGVGFEYELISATPVACELGTFQDGNDGWGTICFSETQIQVLSTTETADESCTAYRNRIGFREIRASDRERLCAPLGPVGWRENELGWRYCR